MTEAEAGVPEQADEFREYLLERGGLSFFLDQDEDVDIGAGEEFAAAESADGEHGDGAEGIGRGAEGLAESIGGEVFDKLSDAGENRSGVADGEEGRAELVPGGGGGEFLH